MINKADLKLKLEEKVLYIVDFLRNYEVISNVNLCDFLLYDHWNKFIPKNFEKSLKLLNEDLYKLPSGILDITEIKLDPKEDIKYFTKHPTLKEFVKASCFLSLKNFEPIKTYENLKAHDEVSNQAREFYRRINSFMGEKKFHEVPVMADVCNHLCNTLGINKVVDIGGGLGYLGIYLETVYGCEVVSVEQVLKRTEAADKRNKLFKKQWKSILKKASANTENKVTILIEDCQQSTTPSENTNPSKAANQTTSPSYFENNFSRGSFKSVPYTINHSEDFENLCQEFSLEASDIVLTGLHACGDLSSNMLHHFCNNPRVKGICLVGCCYNLITESTHSSEANPGFPMSHSLKCQSFVLGDYLKLLACQSPFKTASDDNYRPPRSLYWRALLQLILVEKLHIDTSTTLNKTKHIGHDSSIKRNNISNESNIMRDNINNNNDTIKSDTISNNNKDSNVKKNTIINASNVKSDTPSNVTRGTKGTPPTVGSPVWKVGRVADKCQTFSEYVQKCLEKLQLDLNLSKQELDEYSSRYEGCQSKCLSFYYLRCCLGQCVEALILLDRALFLLEHEDVKNVTICELFDPRKSPRCYALIANK